MDTIADALLFGHFQKRRHHRHSSVLGKHRRRGEQRDEMRVTSMMLTEPVRHCQAELERAHFSTRPAQSRRRTIAHLQRADSHSKRWSADADEQARRPFGCVMPRIEIPGPRSTPGRVPRHGTPASCWSTVGQDSTLERAELTALAHEPAAAGRTAAQRLVVLPCPLLLIFLGVFRARRSGSTSPGSGATMSALRASPVPTAPAGLPPSPLLRNGDARRCPGIRADGATPGP